MTIIVIKAKGRIPVVGMRPLLATWRTKRKSVLRYRTVYRTRKRDLRGVMVRMGTVGEVVEIRGIVDRLFNA